MTTKYEFTGKTRHRVQNLGVFNRRQVLVLQYEIETILTHWMGGMVDSELVTKWIDVKPEWELTTK